MAKHRKKKSGVRRGRRRMGGIGSGMGEALKMIGGATIGVLAGRFINTTMATTSATIMGGAEVAIGGLAVIKGKSPFIKGAGAGLAANGVGYLLGAKGLALLPASIGYGPPGGGSFRSMNGYRDVPKIGSFPKPNAIGKPANMQDQRMARMYAGVYGDRG